MIVLDASAVVELLTDRDERGVWVAERVLRARSVYAPHLLDTEVVSALRGLVAGREIAVETATRGLQRLAEMPVLRYPAYPLLARIWSLREQMTAFDATYVALAEALGLPLVTTDLRLGRSSGHRAVVLAFPG